jgi:predicted dinucleotide-utilizing enzyme
MTLLRNIASGFRSLFRKERVGQRADGFRVSLSANARGTEGRSGTEELIECSDLVVEAASQAAVKVLVPVAIARARHILIMSVGGLLDHDHWFRQTHECG